MATASLGQGTPGRQASQGQGKPGRQGWRGPTLCCCTAVVVRVHLGGSSCGNDLFKTMCFWWIASPSCVICSKRAPAGMSHESWLWLHSEENSRSQRWPVLTKASQGQGKPGTKLAQAGHGQGKPGSGQARAAGIAWPNLVLLHRRCGSCTGVKLR